MNQPLIGFGQVRHARRRPQQHTFTYPTCFLMLPLRSLRQAPATPGAFAMNRPGWLSFYESDHGDGRTPAQGGALGWLDELLQREGITDAKGEVWLQTYPRVLGHTFKPVSFWFCHRASDDQDGALRAIVVEVNNTFGERHCYLLDAPRYGHTQLADKVFHVSPFNPVAGHYAFRFMRCTHDGEQRSVARIDYFDYTQSADAVLQTSISGTLRPLDRAAQREALWRHPALTLGVVLHIHTQALRLWCKRVPWFRKPAPPTAPLTR